MLHGILKHDIMRHVSPALTLIVLFPVLGCLFILHPVTAGNHLQCFGDNLTRQQYHPVRVQ
ncbi:hypothetical protein BDV29DRAFT_185377 [Aspergillus leporis]|uniref:Uncharacterized protein n=1 Tax=Aspergillus leporis TaxID=41062 RepID=A0A5N5WHK1_9EURO|nr:hypothetical protein BDV29DRAFT_185377 [Aspergillus leporis]